MKLKTIGKAGCSFLFLFFTLQVFSFHPTEDIYDLGLKIKCYGNQSECYAKDDYWYEKFSLVKKDELKVKGDHYLFTVLKQEVLNSKLLKKAVVLAMDQVYDKDGAISKNKTTYYTPNRFVYTHTKDSDTLLFGASLHPYRPDLIDRIHEYADKAALFYINPEIQKFNIDSPQMELLAYKLSVAGVPLMIELNQYDNYKIDKILDTGVNVILTGKWFKGEGTSLTKFEYLTSLLTKYSNLYASIDELSIIGTWINYYYMVVYSAPWKQKLVYRSGYPNDHPLRLNSWFFPRLWGSDFIKKIDKVKDRRFDRTILFNIALNSPDDPFFLSKKIISR